MANTIDFEVKLFDTTALAADGSNIPRRSCEAYLQSPDYQVIIRDKVAMGGMTHKDRRLRPELKGLVGMDDQLQINNNATHYITELYFKPGDNFFYASARTFDPSLFAGDRADNITNVIGMLRTGVRMPISVVIQALWSKRGVAEKIIRIKGFDWTQNPSFKGAGDVHIFSKVIEDQPLSDDELKLYSDYTDSGEYEILTKIYSSDGTVTVLDDSPITDSHSDTSTKLYSYQDLVQKYGQFSDEVQSMLNFQNETFSEHLVKDQLFRSGRRYKTRDNAESQINDEIHLNNLLTDHKSQCQDDTIQFSTVSSINDRVNVDKQPRYSKIDRIIKTYQQYWNSKKLTEDEKLRCKLLFSQDISGLIQSVTVELEKGRTLDSLYSLGRYGKEVKLTSNTLSNSYRRVLIAKKIIQYVPKELYGEWTLDMQSFLKAIMIHTFGESIPEFELKMINLAS